MPVAKIPDKIHLVAVLLEDEWKCLAVALAMFKAAAFDLNGRMLADRTAGALSMLDLVNWVLARQQEANRLNRPVLIWPDSEEQEEKFARWYAEQRGEHSGDPLEIRIDEIPF